MEKIHVAPLSSDSIPALFAVPTGNANGMRLCKRIIFIKNGMSYSNYVPITQAEADSKNMFGVARVVNVLDEKHKFKRHMVIKNWVNHVKAAKGAITAVESPIKKPTPSGPVSSFVQIPVSTSEVVTHHATLVNSIKNIQPIAPASKLSTLEVPASKVSNKSNTVSTPKMVSKDSNRSGTNVTFQTKQQQIVKVLPVKHHQQGVASNPSDIKITSVFSLSEKGGLYFSKNINHSAVATTQLNALKQIAGHVVSIKRQTNPQQACDLKYQAAQKFKKALSSGRTNLSVQRVETSKSSISTTGTSSSKELVPSILQPSFVTLKQSHLKEKAGTNFEDRLDTDFKEDEPIDDTKNRISDTIYFDRKSRTVRRSQRRKTATRPYSPSRSSIKSHNSQTVKMERNNNNSPINNTASIQILKGVKHALDENTLMRRNKVLKISLPKIMSLTQEHGGKKQKPEFHNQSLSESFEDSERLMSVTDEAVIKKEPFDASSDDSDNIGYLNSFMKEQQFIMESFMNDSNTMHFPLVMIKKEPLSDDEDTPDQEPVPSKIIKEEPLSDEDEQCTFSKFQADQQCMDANNHTETPYQKTFVEQESVAVPSSREDRVKQLKDRIKEKQNALALFRKRPRISFIDDF